MTETPKTVFVTAHALEDGIREMTFLFKDGAVCWTGIKGDVCTVRQHEPGDWHTTREAAVSRANQMRDAKLTSLAAQVERLRGMRF